MVVAAVASITEAASGFALSMMTEAPASHRGRGQVDSAAAAFGAAARVAARLCAVIHYKELLSFQDVLRSLFQWQHEDEHPQPLVLTGSAASSV